MVARGGVRTLGRSRPPRDIQWVYPTGYTLTVTKVMVSIPADLLAQIDDEAHRRSLSRSALLALAARRELHRRDPEQLTAAIARSEERFARAGEFEAADLVRADRDGRR